MSAENKSESCLQKDSAEHEGYVRARRSFNRIWKERVSAQPELLEKILNKDNLNRAFKRARCCWKKVTGRRGDYWNPARSIWRKH